jgi:hypothetical protein
MAEKVLCVTDTLKLSQTGDRNGPGGIGCVPYQPEEGPLPSVPQYVVVSLKVWSCTFAKAKEACCVLLHHTYCDICRALVNVGHGME